MKKINKLLFITVFFTIIVISYLLKPLNNYFQTSFFEMVQIYAEDEDHEEQDEEDEKDEKDEDDEDDEDDKVENDNSEEYEEYYETEKTNSNTIPLESTQVEPVLQSVIEAGYNIDTDKDGLVDALDPHPTISEVLFFTDTDNDSVCDALDKYPNDDDLLYMEFTDTNNNGVLDSLE